MINNKYMTNKALLQKYGIKILDLTEQSSISKRDAIRLEAIQNEILSRMNNENKNINIMTVEHENWEDFCKLLHYELINKCKCDAETLKQSEKILKQYFPKINIEKTLEYFRENSGYCDCEVLFNVNPL